MANKTISYTVDEKGIAVITLSYPETPAAMSTPSVQEMTDLLGMMEQAREIRAVIIISESPREGPETDWTDLDRRNNSALSFYHQLEEANRFAVTLADLNKPVIAAFNGPATGIGLSIALAADLAIVSTKTNFSELLDHVGLIPDIGGTYLLPRLVGKAKAKEILFTHHRITAQEALQLGLVSQVVSPDEVLSTAYGLAEKIVQGPPFAFSVAKRMINHCDEIDIHAALHMEALSQTLAVCSYDHKEGVNALFENRKPDFKGD